MADESKSTSGKAAAFNRVYFLILVALIVLVLGLYLFFASARQSHGTVNGTQKGMVTTRSSLSS